MPKSKKPRKKGAHGREQAARSRLLRNQFKDPAECRRLVKIVEDARAARHKARVNGILETLAGKGTELHVRTVHGLTLVSFGGRLSFAEEERNRRLERERLKAEEAKREAEEEKSMRVERIEKGRMQAEKIRIMAAPSPNWFDAIVCAGDAHA